MLELEREFVSHNDFETVCMEVGVKSLRQHHQMLSAGRHAFLQLAVFFFSMFELKQKPKQNNFYFKLWMRFCAV